MVKHMNVVVYDKDLQNFTSMIDNNSDWVITDMEVRSSLSLIFYKRVLTWNILLEYEYDSEEDLKNADLDYTE